MSARADRIAVLTHSTNPRGGVVHAIELAEALHALGQDVTLVAPALPGRDFPRPPRCPTCLVPARPVEGVEAMVRARIGEISAFLRAARFDLFHAQDSISANALADLVEAGRIPGFIRTVHHLDRFDDPQLDGWQDRGVRAAAALCCVSLHWQDILGTRFGRLAVLVGNGVDNRRFSPDPTCADDRLRERLGLCPGVGPVFLALGGIEARKNTLSLLHAFLRLRATGGVGPDARLVVAGGATLLDHRDYRAAFESVLAGSGAEDAVRLPGVIADEDMPSLYRLADALVCVSQAEGFGLCALEAMASGRPVVLSDIAPFNQHFAPGEALWADPGDPGSIAAAMHDALAPWQQGRLRGSGPAVARRFNWDAVARNHLPVYARVQGGPVEQEATYDA